MTARRMNHFIWLFNEKTPKDRIVFENEKEEEFYDRLTREANEMFNRTGIWPVFSPCDVLFDD